MYIVQNNCALPLVFLLNSVNAQLLLEIHASILPHYKVHVHKIGPSVEIIGKRRSHIIANLNVSIILPSEQSSNHNGKNVLRILMGKPVRKTYGQDTTQ